MISIKKAAKRWVLGEQLALPDVETEDLKAELGLTPSFDRPQAIEAGSPIHDGPRSPAPEHRQNGLGSPDTAVSAIRWPAACRQHPFGSLDRRERRHAKRARKELGRQAKKSQREAKPARWDLVSGRRPWNPGRHGTRDLIFTGVSRQICGLFPFVVGNVGVETGVPLGPNLVTGEPVCYSPLSWLGARLVPNPTVFIIAQPGVGKSALLKRLTAISAASGTKTIWLGDLKPDGPPLIKALGGQVITLGPGYDRINPLDPGPIEEAAGRLDANGDHEAANSLREQGMTRRLQLVAALCELAAKKQLDAGANVILTMALQHLDHVAEVPTFKDLIALLQSPSEDLVKDCYFPTEAAFYAQSLELTHNLMLMVNGPLRGVFDDQTTTPLDMSAPAIDLDISRLTDEASKSAAMIAIWGYTFALIDAQTALGEAGIIPEVNYAAVLDEMWNALRGAPGLVDRVDLMTRINRTKRVALYMSTHSIRDLEALPTAEDVAKAKGFIDRSGTVIIGAGVPDELEAIAERVSGGLNQAEQTLVASWSSGDDFTPGTQHPWAGCFLIKTGAGRKGIAVRVQLTDIERELYETTHLAETL